MSQTRIEMFLGRLITDEVFRELTKKSLDKACMDYGFDFSEAERKSLSEIDFNLFADISDCIDQDILRAECGRD